jgi:hypothetical protein
MPMPRVPIDAFRIAAVLAAAMLSGCFGARLKPDAPAGIHLQGIWKLNRTASEDPQKVIDAMREEALKKIKRAQNAPPPMQPMGGGPGGQRRRGQQGTPDTTDQLPSPETYGQQPPGPGADPLRNSPMMHELREILQRSDYLTIRQSEDQVSFDYGTSTRSYTPGQHSVVSSENGVADQTTGWDGKQYVIDIKPQLGPVVVEEYGLSPDGKQLIIKTHIGPFELSKVSLTRVYDATGAVVPNSGPSND